MRNILFNVHSESFPTGIWSLATRPAYGLRAMESGRKSPSVLKLDEGIYDHPQETEAERWLNYAGRVTIPVDVLCCRR